VGDDGDAWLKDLERCGNPLNSHLEKNVRSLRKRWWKRRDSCLALCPSCRCHMGVDIVD